MSPAPDNPMLPGVPTFPRFADYFDRLESDPPAVNVATLVGHGAIRSAVMGLRTDRRADADELAQMASHVEAALADGAVGLSSGLAYEPGRYSDVAEMISLTRLVADAGGIYATHMRNEADQLLESIDESIAVAEGSGVRLQISHLKAGGRDNWGRVVDALERIDAARARGVDVLAAQYPYTRGSTLLDQIIVGGALDGTSAFGGMTTDQVQIAAAPRHPEWEGKSITEIAEVEGVPPRTMADQILEAEGRACIVVVDMMSADDVATVVRHPVVMIGSDGVPMGDKPHPRLGHTFPRVLGRFVREQHLLDLPTAVHRMTGMPAKRFGFTDRGTIEAGRFADLVLLDTSTVVDTGTYTEPTAIPTGIAGVWVNGQRVIADGRTTDARPGRVVRAGSASHQRGR
jgi:N-acyl-D-aspartate/D-glutamate deacylase